MRPTDLAVLHRPKSQRPSAVSDKNSALMLKSGANVLLLPSASTLNTVTAVVAIVHKHIRAPACSQLVPSVCLKSASWTHSQASATGATKASLTLASRLLIAPSDSFTQPILQ